MRNPFFDVLKFVAIMLVVYRHVCKTVGNSFGQPIVDNFIVGMNMPLFFVISGYFAAKTIENGDWRKLGKRLIGYFWPIATVSVVFAVLAVAFHIPGSEKGLIGYAGRNALFSTWFLWCLAICFSVTFLCYRPKSPVLRGGGFLLLIIVLPFLSGVWHMHNTRAMLPFFVFGAFVLRRFEVWRNWRIGAACLLVYLLGVFLQGDISKNGLSFYRMATTWEAFVLNWSAFPLYLIRLANGIVGSIGVMWLLQGVVDLCKGLTVMTPLGRTTLGVYLLHYWLLVRIVEFGWCSSSLVSVLIWTGLLFTVSHLVIVVTRRHARCRQLIWGEW